MNGDAAILVHINRFPCNIVSDGSYQDIVRDLGWVSSANVRDSSPIQPSFIIKSFIFKRNISETKAFSINEFYSFHKS